MEYFSIVNLEREPFSNSPDPEFFYGSHQHLECLQKLELALRLRRGLNVIIGDVGTGKTTLCRQLIRRFAKTKEFETHLVLDPGFSSTAEFLVTIIEMLTGRRPPEGARDWQMKEMVKNHLFKRGVDEKKTVALIIDEGQKLPGFCLELLREFLNYETNEYKLLQIVIFAQTEFQNTIDHYANFADRINLYHHLKPMSFGDTRAMIRFRLEKSSTNFKDYTYFSLPALVAIYVASRGYPRKIINLCHRCILTMIIQSRPSVDLFLARTCIRRVFPHRSRRIKRLTLSVGIPLLLLAIGVAAIDIRHQRLSAQTDSSSTDPQSSRSLASYRKIDVVPEPVSAPTTPQSAAADLPPPPAPASPLAAPPQPVPGTAPETADRAATLPSPVPPTVAKPPQLEAPHELGQITIMPNENLYGLIETIYGDVSSLLFQSLLLANPLITDPNLVQMGQTVRVPAVPADVRPLADPVWWISVAHRRSLEDAYVFLRSLTGNARQVRIVSYWTPQNGIQFELLLDRFFPDPLTARITLEQLPVPLSKEGRIVSIWSPEAVFYTDPFFRHQNRRAKG
ncbi:MAG: AAA family ATPase [Desulfobacterales bacterium]|jgi:general secretion pathway protein A